MYERFTDRARKVLQLANQEAMHCKHEYIGTEHILLGLAKEGTGVAANILTLLDIDLQKIRGEVAKIVQACPDDGAVGQLLNTPRAKIVIEYAIEEARSLNRHYVGTEHLFLGLLRDDETVAARVLKKLGFDLKTVRDGVLRIVGHYPDWTDPGLLMNFVKQPDVIVLEEGTPVDLSAGTGIEQLPERVRRIAVEFYCQIAAVQAEKEIALAAQDFKKAAVLRDFQAKLNRLREEFVSQWPKTQ